VIFFLDTSALLKLYLEEDGSAELERACAAPGLKLAQSAMGGLEFRAVLRAMERNREVTALQVDRIVTDLARRGILQQPFGSSVIETAERMLDRHPLRAPDAVQLASCMAVNATQRQTSVWFVCSDRVLLQAAVAEGLRHWDPASGAASPGW